MRYLWCLMFHNWTRYDRIFYGAGQYDVEVESVCYCTTCGRDRTDFVGGPA